MRTLLAFLALTSVAFAAGDTPKNLLRTNMGALPMMQNAQGQWEAVAPENLDWNQPAAAALAGDIGKTVDLSNTKMMVIDLGQVESVDRFSLFSNSATGSMTVYSSPIFEDPQTGKWSELGSLTLTPGQASSLSATPAEARFLKFVFSPNSQGVIGPMGAFGSLTYNDVRAADVLQPAQAQTQMMSLNYATPATSMTPMSSQPEMPAETLMTLFDDDPATQISVNEPTTITVDLGASRTVESQFASATGNAQVSYSISPTLPSTASLALPWRALGSGGSADAPAMTGQYVTFKIVPVGGPASINSLSLIGPVDPLALVFERPASDENVAGSATAAGAGALLPLPAGPPRVTSE